ncbi:MAG: 30S ribosomal protein S12 methylthiotransferase RimO [Candidatus Calescibacterium sp.]|nr:30S ribosomal protein S12 methylthiotransferase RimO [Candidatus Calescibacterium sp.]MCX7733698.1 30S ribosomal protein S12 methylthiotransferase RimO [bacterium]MDW8087518.1 30S ribosomal protein S12 methylthiotransferase RimO [Candidatus Calescibacterium sp.]
MAKAKFFLLNLGCPKNLVDSEKLSLELMKLGLSPSTDPQNSDVVIVNTCGFIDSARKMTEYYVRKLRNQSEGKLIVMGCYPKRVGLENVNLPYDYVAGTIEETLEITENIFKKRLRKTKQNSEIKKNIEIQRIKRINTLSRFSAYLKISEGCSRLCTFCSIPKIRGPLQSLGEKQILEEANYLAEAGVKELVIISQDTTMWNVDKGGKREDIFRLLDKISEIEGIEWIRLFYIYPDRFSISLINYISQNPKIVRYIEMPFQHIDDQILANMARATREKLAYEILENIRTKIPEMAIRTELIVGFPGETDEKFQKLMKFVEEFKFDWLGVFEFSPEKGTPSYKMWEQNQVPKKTVKERKKELMKLWNEIFKRKQSEKIGKIFKCIYESENTYRAYFQAPEIDGTVKIWQRQKNSGQNGFSRSFEYIKIEKVDGENLLGEFVNV